MFNEGDTSVTLTLQTFKDISQRDDRKEGEMKRILSARAVTDEDKEFVQSEMFNESLRSNYIGLLLDSPDVLEIMRRTALNTKGYQILSHHVFAPMGAISKEDIIKVTNKVNKEVDKNGHFWRRDDRHKFKPSPWYFHHINGFTIALISKTVPRGAKKDPVYFDFLVKVIGLMIEETWSEHNLHLMISLNQFLNPAVADTMTFGEFDAKNSHAVDDEFKHFNGSSHQYTSHLLSNLSGYNAGLFPLGVRNAEKVRKAMESLTAQEFRSLVENSEFHSDQGKVSVRNQVAFIESVITSHREKDSLISPMDASNMLIRAVMATDHSMEKNLASKMSLAVSVVNKFCYSAYGERDLRSSEITKTLCDHADQMKVNELIAVLYAVSNGFTFIATGSSNRAKEVIHLAATRSRSVLDTFSFITAVLESYDGVLPTADEWFKMIDDDSNTFDMSPSIILPVMVKSEKERSGMDIRIRQFRSSLLGQRL